MIFIVRQRHTKVYWNNKKFPQTLAERKTKAKTEFSECSVRDIRSISDNVWLYWHIGEINIKACVNYLSFDMKFFCTCEKFIVLKNFGDLSFFFVVNLFIQIQDFATIISGWLDPLLHPVVIIIKR